MSIYSANRSGSMSTATIRANESYNASDLGRIMYESQCNDMAIFEAIVCSDLFEQKAIAEGTMLLSEAEEANRKSFGELMTTLKNRILEWLKKIKGVFQAAIRKISAYILGNNKAFIADFEAAYAARKKAGKVFTGNISVKIYEVDRVKSEIPTADEILKEVEINKNATGVDKQEIIKGVLGGTVKEYKDRITKEYCVDMGCDDKDIAFYKEILSDAKKSITMLDDLKKDIERKVNGMVDVLKKAEREAQHIDKNKNHSDRVRRMTATVGAYEQILTVMVQAGISMVKTNVKNSRKALRAVLGEMKGLSESFIEASVAVDSTDADAALIDSIGGDNVPIDPEAEEEIEQLEAEVNAD